MCEWLLSYNNNSNNNNIVRNPLNISCEPDTPLNGFHIEMLLIIKAALLGGRYYHTHLQMKNLELCLSI